MSKLTKKLTFVLVAVFSVLVAGAALSGCDESHDSAPVNNTGLL